MSFDLDGFLPYQLSVAATKISRRFAALYRAEAGLTIPEWRVLAHLSGSGPVSVRDITARVHLDKSMVSRAATRLEEDGIVSISGHETDRRLVVLELTDKGRDLMTRLGRIAEAFQAELLEELGDDAPPLQRALQRINSDGPGSQAGGPHHASGRATASPDEAATRPDRRQTGPNVRE